MEHQTNSTILQNEIAWLQQVIDQAIRSYFLQEGHEKSWLEIPLPDLSEEHGPFATKVKHWELDVYERLAMALCLAPHLCPEVLDNFFGKNQMYDRGFTEFGGATDKSHSGFIPTGQTFCFLLTATDKELRIKTEQILSKDNILIKDKVLQLAEMDEYIPRLNGILSLSHAWLHYFLTGEKSSPKYGPSFPAQKITSALNWDDLVLDNQVMDQVNEINTWLEHGNTLMNDWRLNTIIKPGYRALFYGPSGTGKTATASLIGKSANRDVYRVDLSMAVSKYIGETEKNILQLFEMARDHNWILFFDNVDALYGKRTGTIVSNHGHNSQQIAYFSQQIEDFPGVVILATDLLTNMDAGFIHIFQVLIPFGMPSSEQRHQLWKNAFAGTCTLCHEIDLHKIAEEYEITGGAIINVLRYCALSAIRRNDTVVTKQELLSGIKREIEKQHIMNN